MGIARWISLGTGKMNIDARLSQVKAIIEERQLSYGDPGDMFANIAERWWPFAKKRQIRRLRRTVALCMAELKMARLRNKWSDDSAIDAIAYLLFALEFDD